MLNVSLLRCERLTLSISGLQAQAARRLNENRMETGDKRFLSLSSGESYRLLTGDVVFGGRLNPIVVVASTYLS